MGRFGRFAVFCVFAVYDILGGAFEILPWTQNTFYWGMAAFILSLAFVLEHRFRRYAAELEKSNVKLKEYSETLEIKVGERTVDLQNKKCY